MRILITGQNDRIPADAMQRSADPRTQRVTRSMTSPPARQPGHYAAPATLDAGAVDRAARFLPPRMRGNSARLCGLAPSFDASAGRWIAPPSGRKPDAGAAADLRQPTMRNTRINASPSRPATPFKPPAGRALRALADACWFGMGVMTGFALLVILTVLWQ